MRWLVGRRSGGDDDDARAQAVSQGAVIYTLYDCRVHTTVLTARIYVKTVTIVCVGGGGEGTNGQVCVTLGYNARPLDRCCCGNSCGQW